MNTKAFTMLEIIVICIIVGILAAMGIPYFQNVMEQSKAEVCATNLKALQKAVDIYVQENDVVPASLAALPREDVDSAFAALMQEKGAWKRRLAFLIRDISERGIVYAATQYFPKLRCPKAGDNANASYALAGGISGLTASAYAALPGSTPVVEDTAARHITWSGFTKKFWQIAVTKTGYAGCRQGKQGDLNTDVFGLWPPISEEENAVSEQCP